jgi:hypothetical protein
MCCLLLLDFSEMLFIHSFVTHNQKTEKKEENPTDTIR